MPVGTVCARPLTGWSSCTDATRGSRAIAAARAAVISTE